MTKNTNTGTALGNRAKAINQEVSILTGKLRDYAEADPVTFLDSKVARSYEDMEAFVRNESRGLINAQTRRNIGRSFLAYVNDSGRGEREALECVREDLHRVVLAKAKFGTHRSTCPFTNAVEEAKVSQMAATLAVLDEGLRFISRMEEGQ